MSPTAKPDTPDTEEPTPGFLKKLETATYDSVRKALQIPDKPANEKLQPLTPAQRKQLQEIEEKAIADFQGDLTQLEAALGMLRLGHHVGWKVLYIVHSKKTIRNYEKILGRQIREIFEPEGPSSYRSFGFVLAGKFRNFWKVVAGETKIPHRQTTAG